MKRYIATFTYASDDNPIPGIVENVLFSTIEEAEEAVKRNMNSIVQEYAVLEYDYPEEDKSRWNREDMVLERTNGPELKINYAIYPIIL